MDLGADQAGDIGIDKGMDFELDPEKRLEPEREWGEEHDAYNKHGRRLSPRIIINFKF